MRPNRRGEERYVKRQGIPFILARIDMHRALIQTENPRFGIRDTGNSGINFFRIQPS
jgi:hypothetical protein